MTDTAVDASSPVVGSSRNKTDGDIINSIPMLVRFRSPPEIPRMNSFPTYKRQTNDKTQRSKLFLLILFFTATDRKNFLHTAVLCFGPQLRILKRPITETSQSVSVTFVHFNTFNTILQVI